jgi:hypothetical protein
MLAFLAVAMLLVVSEAAYITSFENCLQLSPVQLQFTPLFLFAAFDLSGPSHGLDVVVYGNISGTAFNQSLPTSPNDPRWSDGNFTVGKLPDVSQYNPKPTRSTLFSKFYVLNTQIYDPPGSPFCESVLGNSECPVSPVFTNET